MIKVDQYQLIRKLYAVEGSSQREIAKRLGISRNTVRKYCKGEHKPLLEDISQPAADSNYPRSGNVYQGMPDER